MLLNHVNISEQIRKESRQILTDLGYILVSGNLSNLDDEHPFEDWYLDGKFFDSTFINIFKRTDDNPLAAHKYMLEGY